VVGGGLHSHEEVSGVATDVTVTDGHPESKAYIGGLSVVDVPSREEALEWAAKIAVACRCAQEVREFLPDPAVGNFDACFRAVQCANATFMATTSNPSARFKPIATTVPTRPKPSRRAKRTPSAASVTSPTARASHTAVVSPKIPIAPNPS